MLTVNYSIAFESYLDIYKKQSVRIKKGAIFDDSFPYDHYLLYTFDFHSFVRSDAVEEYYQEADKRKNEGHVH